MEGKRTVSSFIGNEVRVSSPRGFESRTFRLGFHALVKKLRCGHGECVW